MSEEEKRLSKSNAMYKKMTETPVPKLVITLGIPTTISMLVTSVYNLADTYFVSQEGNSASGAIGVVFGLMAVIQAFGFMYGQGSGVVASKALGAKNNDRADRSDSTGFALALITGAVIGILGLILIDPVMDLLGSTPTILPYARKYSIFILIAAPFMCASCVLNNILRFEGKAFFSMIGLCTGAGLNIFGDWLLIKVLGMGVSGAGIATAVSQTISFCLLLVPFLTGRSEGKLRIRSLTFTGSMILDICKTGLPSLVRQGLASLSTMLLNNCAKPFGDAAVAAMSIVNRVCFFTFATALGIGQGFQPVCSFNFGAKRFDRVRKAYIFTFITGEIFLGVVAVIGFFLSGNIIAGFRNDPEVIMIGTTALAAQFIGQLFQPLTVCSNMLFQSVGDSLKATFISICRNGLCFIPVLLISTSIFGLPGVQYSQAVSDMLTFMIAAPFGIMYVKKLKQMESAEKTKTE
ncbi:MAG: MATE family efflux transporter [Lachnospiraceae bacterium]|nr:MATE family efflux transporter [Lachnospiraceae bacterium]